MLRYTAFERVPLIPFPLFIAITVNTKLHMNVHVKLHAAVRQNRDQTC